MAPEVASAPSNEQPSGALSARMAGMLSGFAVSQALYVVAKLDLAAKLLTGPRTPADWADEDCARLLARIREAARPCARLVVIEALLPQGDEQHPSKLSDLVMVTMAGGRERSESEYTTLLGDAGFVVDRTVDAPDGGYCAIEATLKAG
jgi:hypothetical protein